MKRWSFFDTRRRLGDMEPVPAPEKTDTVEAIPVEVAPITAASSDIMPLTTDKPLVDLISPTPPLPDIKWSEAEYKEALESWYAQQKIQREAEEAQKRSILYAQQAAEQAERSAQAANNTLYEKNTLMDYIPYAVGAVLVYFLLKPKAPVVRIFR